MRILLFGENTWLYPDNVPERGDLTEMYLARGGHAGAQVVIDGKGGDARAAARLPDGVAARWYRMLPVPVERNSAPDVHTTLDYEAVKSYVSRRAPFEVYDAMEPIGDPARVCLEEGENVLFVRLEASPDAKPLRAAACFEIAANGEKSECTIPLRVTNACVPPAAQSDFSVNNWLDYNSITVCHGAAFGTARYDGLLDAYLASLLDLRCNHLKLPGGVPVRDERGQVAGFDFTACEAVARRALAKGFRYVLGGFAARFRVWDEPEHFLLWDRDTAVTSMEGYRQLKLYFTALWSIVTANGWQDRWMQCLVDEPQFPNSMSYRALSAICRKCMPGVVINDPVETTDIQGAADIWCVKQAVFDKYREDFRRLQRMGERLTVYTCGYPAGKWMNRATDLPLTAGRLPFWRCAAEGLEGFLHWGYNSYGGVDPWKRNCYPVGDDNAMPPGNGFIVYPGENGPIPTLRAQIQLFGAEDAELLRQLLPERRQELCGMVSKDFREYDPSPERFANAHRLLMTAFG